MRADKTRCNRYTESPDKHMGIVNYFLCDRKIVAKVKYKKGTTGKFVQESVCSMHLNSTKKYAERMKKKLDYDVELKITKP